MADQKLTERVELTNSNGLDLVHVVRHNDSYKMKASLLSSNQSTQSTGNYALGGVMFLGSGLGYKVWVFECFINGVLYTNGLSSTVTLSDGNATYSRLDRFVVTVDDSANLTLSAIEGVPSANPLLPNLNVTTQAEISFRLTASGETADTTTSTDLIYNENTGSPSEWDNTTSPSGSNLNNTTNPYDGSKSFSAPANAAVAPTLVSWTKTTSVDFNSNNTLIFPLKAVLTTNSQIQIKLSKGATYWLKTLRYSDIRRYGFDVSLSTWQLIQVPLSAFFPNSKVSTEYNKIEFGFIETPVLNLDWINIQGGLAQPNPVPVTSDILKETRITLSSNQIRSLGTTPIVAVPAQGLNTVIELISVTAKLNYWLSTYDNNSLLIKSGSIGLGSISSFINSSTNKAKNADLTYDVELNENTDITINGTDSAVGTGTVDVYITYKTVNLVNSNPVNM